MSAEEVSQLDEMSQPAPLYPYWMQKMPPPE
jgi:hypothetical protein